MDKQFYTRKEICQALGVKGDAFNHHLKKGHITAAKKRKRKTGGYENLFSTAEVTRLKERLDKIRSLRSK